MGPLDKSLTKMSLKQSWMPLVRSWSWTSRRLLTSRCWTSDPLLAFLTSQQQNRPDLLLPKHLERKRKIQTWPSLLPGPPSGCRAKVLGTWDVEVTVMRESDNYNAEAPYSHKLCPANIAHQCGDSCDFVICFPFLDTILYQCFNKL